MQLPNRFRPKATPSSYKAGLTLTGSNSGDFSLTTRSGEVYTKAPNLASSIPEDSPALLAVKGRQVVSLGVGGFASAT